MLSGSAVINLKSAPMPFNKAAYHSYISFSSVIIRTEGAFAPTTASSTASCAFAYFSPPCSSITTAQSNLSSLRINATVITLSGILSRTIPLIPVSLIAAAPLIILLCYIYYCLQLLKMYFSKQTILFRRSA